MPRKLIRAAVHAPSWTWVIVAGALAHALLPLTDYVLWDGWWYATDLQRSDGPANMSRLFHEIGRPMDLYFYEPLRWSGGDPVLLAKCLGVTAWVVTPACVFVVLRRLGRLPETLAIAVTVLMTTLPVFDILGDLAIWMNTACVLLFWLSWLGFSYLQSTKGLRRIATRLALMGSFFVSFNLNSNLVFFYAIGLALAACRAQRMDFAEAKRLLRITAVGFIDFLSLPIVFWIWKTWFTPTSGVHTDYNRPSFDVMRLFAGYVGVGVDFLLPCAYDIASSPLALFFAVTAVAVAIYLVKSGAPADTAPLILHTRPLFLWCTGLVLLLAAAFPYLAVGQPLGSEGWVTRNCILCPLPVALILVACLLEANRRLMPGVPRAWLVGVVAIAAAGVGGCVQNYLRYQTFGMKQIALRHAFHETIHETDATVIQFRDYAPIPRTIGAYPPIIWSFIASYPPLPPRTLVIETASFAPDNYVIGSNGEMTRFMPRVSFDPPGVELCIEKTLMPYAFTQVRRQGPQALLAAYMTTDGAPTIHQAIRYLCLRMVAPAKALKYACEFIRPERAVLPNIE